MPRLYLSPYWRSMRVVWADSYRTTVQQDDDGRPKDGAAANPDFSSSSCIRVSYDQLWVNYYHTASKSVYATRHSTNR